MPLRAPSSSLPRTRRTRNATLPSGVETKLVRPNPGANVLDRPQLLETLIRNAEKPVTLVIADAGYGKTTTLAAYVRSLRRPVVWYSLMPSDADLVVFCRCLLAGIRREYPRFGRAFEQAVEEARPGGRSAEMLAGTLANQLAALRPPGVVVILDDYQEIAGHAPIGAFMATLLRQFPSGLRLIIASRTMPPLPLERLRAAGSVAEMDSEQLRLRREDLQRLFEEVYRRPLATSELDSLERISQGWPTAVHLIHESLRRSTDATIADVLADFRASDLGLHDYLSAEVFARLDLGTRHLLERTAPFERFDAELARRVAEQADVRPALAALARRGLLRSFGIGERTTFEWPELVRRFVRHEIESRTEGAAWAELEARAGAALAERGDLEPALRHYLAAGQRAEAAALLRTVAPGLLRQGRAAALRHYLGELPPELVREDVELGIALADAQQALGAWDEAETRYQDVLERCRAAPSPEADVRLLECRALLGLGKVGNLRGRHEQVLGMAERGLAMSQGLPIEVHARLLQMKAGAHFYLGQFQAAVRVLDQVRALLEGHDEPELVVPTIHNLAVAYAAQGRIREASDEFRYALAQVRGADSPRAPLYLSNLASLLTELGELSEARRAAEEGLVAAQRFSNRSQECVCHQALAQILAQGGDLEGALADLRHAEELNAELRMEVIAADLLVLRGRIFCARGEYRRGAEFLRQAIERGAGRADAPRLEVALAWCELRAGRVGTARDLLLAMAGRVDAGEDDLLRTRVNYWLGEARLALGETQDAERHLERALHLARERGYQHFLSTQAREEPGPLLAALARGIEPDLVAGALVEAGDSVESPLLELLPGASSAVGEAVIAVLAEVGGARAQTALEKLGRARRALQPACRAALRHIGARLSRGVAPGERAESVTRLLVFGRPRLEVDGRAIPAAAWRAQRAFQMLIYLALHPRGASRDDLLESFWPGRQAAAGRRNFHPTLSYVRHVLPKSATPILHEAGFYRLNPEYPLTCDAWDFERRMAEASAMRGAERRQALESAIELASGAFLDGLYVDWADTMQTRMRDRLEKALTDLGDLRARDGEYESALTAFRRAAELDGFREPTRLAVIECLLRLGNRRAAINEYEKLKETLRAELGVDPMPDTEESVRRLMAGKGRKEWPGETPALAAEDQGKEWVGGITQAPRKRPEGVSTP
ncbi:MAG TPA: BTAD domain-containing putative transcriptional regulator [Candidatus Eisenbacteria bacterium]|nr:BTAD domain-containing putative transcriptional regulator [Candidatus Eisenbacteria bacterium]